MFRKLFHHKKPDTVQSERDILAEKIRWHRKKPMYTFFAFDDRIHVRRRRIKIRKTILDVTTLYDDIGIAGDETSAREIVNEYRKEVRREKERQFELKKAAQRLNEEFS